MTLDDFMAALAQTPRNWRLKDYGEIRCTKESLYELGPWEACPWTYLATPGFENDPHYYMPQRIFFAADNTPGHDVELRKRLLAACGLEEMR